MQRPPAVIIVHIPASTKSAHQLVVDGFETQAKRGLHFFMLKALGPDFAAPQGGDCLSPQALHLGFGSFPYDGAVFVA